MRFNFRTKLFLTLFLYGVFLLLIATTVVVNYSQNSIGKTAIENAEEIFRKNRNLIRFYLDNMQAKLDAVMISEMFQRHLDKDGFLDREIEDLFLSIASSDNCIMQLRFLNTKGREIIRVDRDACYTIPYLVNYNDLQNKEERYYFKKIISLNEKEYWLSNLDLNMEHKKIERPFKPVMRMGTPVYKHGKKVGVLIVNVFMEQILKQLSSSKLYHIYIVDKDGYFILHPNPRYNFSRYLESHKKVEDFFPDADKILHGFSYKSDRLYAGTLGINNGESLRMIVEPTAAFLHANKRYLFEKITFVIVVLLLFSAPIAFFLAKPYARLKKDVDILNDNLESKINEQTQELIKLNKTLENKVKERTKEQELLLSLFDLGDAVLFKWRNDEHWSVEYVSKSVEKLLGYTPYEFLHSKITYAECIHQDDLPRVIKEVNEAVAKKLYFFTHEPYRVITKDKKTKWIHDNTVISRNEQGEIKNFIGYLTDITPIKEQEIQMQRLSITDRLTQVYNRLFLDQVLNKQHYRLVRNGELCSLILMDIDHFKSINDKYGHLVGDSVLKELATLVKENLRESDTFGRWGGEEFMIIAPHTNASEAYTIAEKIKKLIENHIFEDVGHITVSFGITECKKDHTIDTDISIADKALYRSKNEGRNRVTLL